MQARQNPPAGWVCTFCHSTLSSLLALSSVFTGVQRGQRHPIQLPGAVPVGVLLHSGHAAGSGCSVCVCVCGCGRKHTGGPQTLPHNLPICTHTKRLHRAHAFRVGNCHSWECKVIHLRAAGRRGPWVCGGHTLNEGHPPCGPPCALTCVVLGLPPQRRPPFHPPAY